MDINHVRSPLRLQGWWAAFCLIINDSRSRRLLWVDPSTTSWTVVLGRTSCYLGLWNSWAGFTSSNRDQPRSLSRSARGFQSATASADAKGRRTGRRAVFPRWQQLRHHLEARTVLQGRESPSVMAAACKALALEAATIWKRYFLVWLSCWKVCKNEWVS